MKEFLRNNLKKLKDLKHDNIDEVLNDIFPVTDKDNKYILHYVSYSMGKPSVCFGYYLVPLKGVFRLEHIDSHETIEEEVFLGDFPIPNNHEHVHFTI